MSICRLPILILVTVFAGTVAHVPLFSSASAATASGTFSESFDQGLVGWSLGGLWRRGESPFPSGSPALNYSDESGTYDIGAWTQGEAVSPFIRIGEMTRPVLRFRCSYETEGRGALRDRRILRLSIPGPYPVAEHWIEDSSALRACTSYGTWHDHFLPLDAGWGTISMTFEFDSVDKYWNNYGGWSIDDVRICEAVDIETGPTFFDSDFDAPGQPAWVLNGLWNTDSNPASAAGGPVRSAPFSLNFNNGKDYSTGSATSGTATSERIYSPGLPSRLSFWCNYNTETVGTRWDRRTVRIVHGGDTAVLGSPASTYQLATHSSTPGAGDCASMGVWHRHEIHIPLFRGWIRIQFKFDSVDSILNRFQGWFLDDIRIQSDRAGFLHQPVASYPPKGTASNFDPGQGKISDFTPLWEGNVILGLSDAGAVAVMNALTSEVLAWYDLVPTGGETVTPGSMVYDAESSLLYVLVPDRSLVRRIDLRTGAQADLGLDARPTRIAMGNNGRVFVGLDSESDNLVVLKGTTGQVLARFRIEPADLMVFNRARNHLYTMSPVGNLTLFRYQWDENRNQLSRDVEIPDFGGTALGLAVNPTGLRIKVQFDPDGTGSYWQSPANFVDRILTFTIVVSRDPWFRSSNRLARPESGQIPAVSTYSPDGLRQVITDGTSLRIGLGEFLVSPIDRTLDSRFFTRLDYSRDGYVLFAFSDNADGGHAQEFYVEILKEGSGP